VDCYSAYVGLGTALKMGEKRRQATTNMRCDNLDWRSLKLCTTVCVYVCVCVYNTIRSAEF
jgi:hypothetical protein